MGKILRKNLTKNVAITDFFFLTITTCIDLILIFNKTENVTLENIKTYSKLEI